MQLSSCVRSWAQARKSVCVRAQELKLQRVVCAKVEQKALHKRWTPADESVQVRKGTRKVNILGKHGSRGDSVCMQLATRKACVYPTHHG